MADTEIVIAGGIVFNDTEGGDEIVVAGGLVLQEETAPPVAGGLFAGSLTLLGVGT